MNNPNPIKDDFTMFDGLMSMLFGMLTVLLIVRFFKEGKIGFVDLVVWLILLEGFVKRIKKITH